MKLIQDGGLGVQLNQHFTDVDLKNGPRLVKLFKSSLMSNEILLGCD